MDEVTEKPPELIAVDLPYRELVLKHLKDIDAEEPGLTAEASDSNRVLNLGLIRLLAATRTANNFMVKWGHRIPLNPQPQLAGVIPSDLDKILDGLRLAIGDQHGGWYPPMGKVRNTDVVGGLPHIGSGWEYPDQKIGVETQFELAQATTEKEERPKIGVIDSLMYRHSALDGRWSPADGYPPGLPEEDEYPWLYGHAAFVVGRILSRAPDVWPSLYSVLVGDPQTGEVPKTTVWNLAETMVAAFRAGIRVLNLSLGCYTVDGKAPFVLERAVDVLSRQGVAIVAAAGNHGKGNGGIRSNAPIFPAACPGAVAVGAFELAGEYPHAAFSPEAPWIALGAPGAEVRSTYLLGPVRFSQLRGLPEPPENRSFDGYATWSGTSFASGSVSAEIARRMAETGKDPLAIVDDLRHTDPADNDGIGRYNRP